MVSFGDLSKGDSLAELDQHLATRSYIDGWAAWPICRPACPPGGPPGLAG